MPLNKWFPCFDWDIEIALEDCNFIWKRHDLEELKLMWEQNFSLDYISDYFDRDVDEIVLGIMHLSKKNIIRSRKFGLLGGIR